MQPNVLTWTATDFSLLLQKVVKWDVCSPSALSASVWQQSFSYRRWWYLQGWVSTSQDRLSLACQSSLWKKHPQQSVAVQTLGTETLMIFRSLLCIHAIISIFISHSLFLTKLQGAVRKKFSPHVLWCLHFLPQSVCYWESLETGCCSVWTSDLMQVDCFKYCSTGFWPDLLGPIWS